MTNVRTPGWLVAVARADVSEPDAGGVPRRGASDPPHAVSTSPSRTRGMHLTIGELFERTRPLSHRPIFEISNPIWGRAADEFSDKSARDIVLLNCAEWTRNQ